MNELESARQTINEIDEETAVLFERRMKASGEIAKYKEKHGLPIFDASREADVLRRGGERIKNEALRGYYTRFQKSVMDISKSYQSELICKKGGTDGNVLHVNLGGGYDIILSRGVTGDAEKHLDLRRKVLVVTDSGVPAEYAEKIAAKCRDAVTVTVPEGEGSKSISTYEMLLKKMLDNSFTRTDCVAAVGGGMVSDLAGFAAASYMRGIDFYAVPTTVLSQIDASVGGKVAVNLDSVKNVVGAFYQPKKVLIDPELLSTLPKRHFASGLAEALKMGLTSDAELYRIFAEGKAPQKIDEVIRRSLKVKISVVEQDEKETGLRKILNFGHTLGHGIEAYKGLSELYHGECVALGMIPMCAPEIRAELVSILDGLGLPTKVCADIDEITSLAAHDKKCNGDMISLIYVDRAGSYRIEKKKLSCFRDEMRTEFAPYCIKSKV